MVRSLAVASLLVSAGTVQAQSLVYRAGFESPAGGWSTGRHYSARPGSTVLGRFHNETSTLTLDNLPAHAQVIVAFDLHLIGAWSGEQQAASPTTFTATLDGATLLHSSFANDDGTPSRQSFPEEPGQAANPAGLGAYRLNALDARSDAGRRAPDSLYRMVLAAPHEGGTLKLSLRAANLPADIKHASWAVDNVVVYAVPNGVDVNVYQAAAREAVVRTSLGMNVEQVGPPAASVRPLPAFDTRPLPLNLGSMEQGLPVIALPHVPAVVGNASKVSGAEMLPDRLPPEQLALGVARDMALIPAIPATIAAPVLGPAAAPVVVAAGAGRLEQPVIRRTAGLVYNNRFESAPGSEWSKASIASAPRGERFMGPMGNEQTTLTLPDLEPHDQLIIDADLYTLGDWPGDGPVPSQFVITVDGTTVLAESFATEDGAMTRTQSYPSGGRHMPGKEAAAIDSLGFAPANALSTHDTHYRLRFVVPHNAPKAQVVFTASGLTPGAASWGLDNLHIVASGSRAMSYSEATGVAPDDKADDGDYMNPFVRDPGDEWSVTKTEQSPSGERFLGRMGNGKADLTVTNFPHHTHLAISADVVVAGAWQGNSPEPSKFSITLSDGTEVFASTFATADGGEQATQSYPGKIGENNLPGSGATSVGTFGYIDSSGKPADTVYRLVFHVQHTGDRETISFAVSGLKGDESAASWGLDNVSVTSIDSEKPVGNITLGDAGALAWGNPSGGTIGGYSSFDPLGSNPFIPTYNPTPFPQNPDGGGGGGGGNTPLAPAPGVLPALLAGGAVAFLRRRRQV